MTGRLALYVGRMFLGRVLGAVLVFAALLQVLDLLDAATDIMDRGRGLGGIAYYAMLRLPITLEQTFPLGVLIGALLTFASLARHNEVVIMRVAGYPIFRLASALLLPTLAVAGLHLTISDRVVPGFERRLAVWWEEAPSTDEDKAKPVWLRVGGDLLSVDRILQAGTRLEGVRIYSRDEKDQLHQRTYAPAAVLEGGRWRLIGASESVIQDGRIVVGPAADRGWNVHLAPSDLIERMMPFAHISAATARSALTGDSATARAPAYYETRLQRIFAEPLGSAVMLLLATPAASASRRAGQAGRRLLAGLSLGMLFLLVDGILAALGEAGRIDPVLAAWGAIGLFACIGITILLNLDA